VKGEITSHKYLLNEIKKNVMSLVKERTIKNGFKNKLKNIYVNTLIPHFQFKNEKGNVIRPTNICINL